MTTIPTPGAASEPTSAQRMFDTLKRITRYQTPQQLRRRHEKDWGLPFDEAIEYAYENIQQEARNAIKGMRRPK